jgi:hypothetical protein
MKQLTTEEAIAFAESESYVGMSYRELAEFQINQEMLCMPFSVFHEAVEEVLGRPVWTHEFGLNAGGIKAEIMGGKEPPTLDEIISLIPLEKRLVVGL